MEEKMKVNEITTQKLARSNNDYMILLFAIRVIAHYTEISPLFLYNYYIKKTIYIYLKTSIKVFQSLNFK